MKNKRSPVEVHPNTPAALKRDLRRCFWNMRALARLRKVNYFFVHELITKGIEPVGRVERVKLSLPARKRRPRVPGPPKPPAPAHVRWWRKLPKEARDKVITSVYEGFCKYQKENEHA